jgi:ATP-binding cassette, subfamily B, bacterial
MPQQAVQPLKDKYAFRIDGVLCIAQPRSVLPGRERWRVSIDGGIDDITSSVERFLSGYPGVHSVSVNRRIGSVLLVFDPSLTASGTPFLLQILKMAQSAVGRGLTSAAPSPIQAPRREQGWRLPIAALLLAGTASAAAFVPLSYLVGAAVLGSSFVILRHYWLHSRWSRQKDVTTSAHDRSHPLHRLLELNPGLRSQVMSATACSAGAKLVDAMPALAQGVLITILTAGPLALLAAIGLATPLSQVVFVVAVGSAAWCFQSALEYRAIYLWRNVAQTAQHDLRIHAYSHVQDLEFEVLENERVGRLASVLNEDVNQIQTFLDASAHDFIQLIVNLAMIAPLFYIVAPSVAWVSVLPIPLLMWISFRYVDQTAPLYAEVRRKAGAVNSQLVSNLDGIAVIKSFATEEYEIERIGALSEEYRKGGQQTAASAAAYGPTIRMTMLVAWSGTVLVGGIQAIQGTISVGVFTSMISLARSFLWPIVILGKTVDEYQRTAASADRVFDVIDIPTRAARPCLPLAPSRMQGEIVMDRVSFAYRNRPPVFTDLSLRFARGANTAIVGSTGSGKTTIVKLLLRFYEVGGGRVLLDGTDIREFDARDLRRRIGLVGQDVFLFEGTIRDNIAYGTFDASMDSIVQAAQLAEMHAFIDSLPLGYQTIVGERGVKLSGGQRQRISLARAILKDPAVLILDEATSSIDSENEAAIQRALKQVCVGRTTITVAHRLSTIRDADWIYVLDDRGAVEDQGTHQDLLGRGGLYLSMWNAQSDEPGRLRYAGS